MKLKKVVKLFDKWERFNFRDCDEYCYLKLYPHGGGAIKHQGNTIFAFENTDQLIHFLKH